MPLRPQLCFTHLLATTLIFSLYTIAPAAADDLTHLYNSAPLAFTGQSIGDADQAFVARGQGYAIQITPSSTTVLLRRVCDYTTDLSGLRQYPSAYAHSAISLRLLNANRSNPLEAEQPTDTQVSYLTAGRLCSTAPSFARLRQAAVYDGIDLVQYGNQGRLEFDFVVAPQADPDQIAFVYDHACGVCLESDGRLTLETDLGPLTVQAPVAYQESGDARIPVEAAYKLDAYGVVRFVLGEYDRSQALVIDPLVSYRQFLAGAQDDQAQDIAIDADGNAYICGQTISADFPVNSGALDENLGPEPVDGQVGSVSFTDAFVAKFAPNGDPLYVTYLGGTDEEIAWGIDVDAEGNAYICGQTRSMDFPTTPGAWSTEDNRTASPVVGEGFVCKLDPTGSMLLYSTFLGDSNADRSEGVGTVTGFDACSDIAIDAEGNAYITGDTASPLFVTTENALDTSLNTEPEDGQLGGIVDFARDGFVCKLDPTGSNLLYSTFLGGAINDRAAAIAIDADGNAYVTGWTQSADFPVTSGAYEVAFNETPGVGLADPTGDAFVTILNATGTGLVASTYLGDRDTPIFEDPQNGTARGMDFGTSITRDAAGYVYVCGATFAPYFPTTEGAYDRVRDSLGEDGQTGDLSSSDAFVAKFLPDLSDLVWSTFLGNDGTEFANDLAVDSLGNVHVCGSTSGGDLFPETPNSIGKQGYVDLTIYDCFYTVFSADGSTILESTRFGGTSSDDCQGLKIDSFGNAYLAGYTYSGDDFVNPLYDPDAEFVNVGGQFGTSATLSDAWVVRFNQDTVIIGDPTPTFTPACPVAALSMMLFALGGTVYTGRRQNSRRR